MFKEHIIKEKEPWNNVIEGFISKDIYFTYDYFVPFQNNGDGEPILFYFECEYGKVAYPFMLRDIASSKNFKDSLEENKYFDISSAYGYGGVIFENYIVGETICNLQESFFKSFTNYCNNTNIISQFDRFHPLINNHSFCDGYCDLYKIRKTVHIDLVDRESIWINIDSKCRNMIKKAQKNEIVIVLEDEVKTLEDFKRIYKSTMDQKNAAEYYFFNESFFDETINNLGKNIFISNAYYGGEIIASSLILRKGHYLHYHFSGALKEHRSLQANNLLIYEVAMWGNKHGFKKFHLGGGYDSESDSLYKFKKSFSKLDDNDFYIGKKIYNYDQYDYLINVISKKNAEETSFFPAYRNI